ncbi:alpha/beta fold hydrolase [Cohnella suwonensis]|uniref:Alpha/beta fold hydrolase n=1 Tax=Cohnella suwonensis TaxID=696072 RepID=A0ABW0LWJ6_9BACL
MIKAKTVDRVLPSHVVIEKDDRLLARLQNEEPTGFEKFTVVQTEKVWVKFQKDILTGAQKADRTFLSSEFRTKGYAYSFESMLSGKTFDKPSLILLGHQDAISGYKDAMQLIESYPRCTLSILDRAGHFPQLEQEKLVHALSEEWLQRLEKEV